MHSAAARRPSAAGWRRTAPARNSRRSISPLSNCASLAAIISSSAVDALVPSMSGRARIASITPQVDHAGQGTAQLQPEVRILADRQAIGQRKRRRHEVGLAASVRPRRQGDHHHAHRRLRFRLEHDLHIAVGGGQVAGHVDVVQGWRSGVSPAVHAAVFGDLQVFRRAGGQADADAVAAVGAALEAQARRHGCGRGGHLRHADGPVRAGLVLAAHYPVFPPRQRCAANRQAPGNRQRRRGWRHRCRPRSASRRP